MMVRPPGSRAERCGAIPIFSISPRSNSCSSMPAAVRHRENLRLDDPAFSVRMSLAMTLGRLFIPRGSAAAARRSLVRPFPALNFRHVLAVLFDVMAVLGQLVAEMLRHMRGLGGETRHPLDHVHRQVEAVEPVEHDHVEGGGG